MLRTINCSQKSIRNNLIRLGKMEGEITPRRYVVEGKDIIIEDENYFFDFELIQIRKNQTYLLE